MSTAKPASTPVVELRGAVVELPGGHRALDRVDLEIRAGEIHALMGQNGAGKSTVVRALAGVWPLTAGTMCLDGAPVHVRSPKVSRAAGIATVFQDAQLLPHLTVAENVMLGREPRGRWGIDWGATRRHAHELLTELGLEDLDVGQRLASLPVAARQLVAIARAMVDEPRVVLLDEPTAGLQQVDVDRLFAVLRRMRDKGVAIVFISHFLEQVFAISDRITVLRDGAKAGEIAVGDLDRVELISMMLGADLPTLQQLASQRAQHSEVVEGVPLLRAEGIGRANAVRPTDLALHGGEIVGLAGLRGSGRTELARLLTGHDRADQGRLFLSGAALRLRGPRQGMLHGLVLSSERRNDGGIIRGLSVRDNLILSLQALRGWNRPIPTKEREGIITWALRAFGLGEHVLRRPVDELSGGEQQKVALARLFVTRPRVLVLDEPTRGCDIPAKVDIQRLIATLAGEGGAILVISSELDELVRLADRIVVLKDRGKIGEISNGPGVSVDTLVELIAASD